MLAENHALWESARGTPSSSSVPNLRLGTLAIRVGFAAHKLRPQQTEEATRARRADREVLPAEVRPAPGANDDLPGVPCKPRVLCGGLPHPEEVTSRREHQKVEDSPVGIDVEAGPRLAQSEVVSPRGDLRPTRPAAQRRVAAACGAVLLASAGRGPRPS